MGVKIIIRALESDLDKLKSPCSRLYLGGAYSNTKDKDDTWGRHNLILSQMSKMYCQVYSPIVHSHWADQLLGEENEKLYHFWLNHCLDMLRFWATGMLVYKDPENNYLSSSGLHTELRTISALNMPIGYLEMHKSNKNILQWRGPGGKMWGELPC